MEYGVQKRPDTSEPRYLNTEARLAMFTGIVETLGIVRSLAEAPPGIQLEIDAGPLANDVQIGDSVAINGCCLTVVSCDAGTMKFDAGSETLGRTNLGQLAVKDSVNLERSLRVGDRLGGHYVTGHIDAIGTLDLRIDDHDWSTFWISYPEHLQRQLASKGSIAVDGVSLTLVDVEQDRFSVALIPHTLQITTLGRLRQHDPVNLETDVLAKYVETQLNADR